MTKSFKRGDRRHLSNKIRKARICNVVDLWGFKGEFGWQGYALDDWGRNVERKFHNRAINHHPLAGESNLDNDYRSAVPRRKELRADFTDGDEPTAYRKMKRRRSRFVREDELVSDTMNWLRKHEQFMQNFAADPE